MEKKILGYLDGRLKESERLELEKHLASCGACRLRVNEFRAVSGLLEELPVIEPSEAFDARLRARVAAEPVTQSWWAWLTPSPRVAFAASLLLLATVWLGSRPPDISVSASEIDKINQNMTVLENYDVLSDFGALSELPPAPPPDDAIQTNQVDQNQQM